MNNKLVDDYIAAFPQNTQQKLIELRAIIHHEAPHATEIISYKMPAYKLKRILVFFAGYKNHIGFYPSGSGIQNFQHELGNLKWSKGAIQFPLDSPLPEELIRKIIQFRIKEDTI